MSGQPVVVTRAVRAAYGAPGQGPELPEHLPWGWLPLGMHLVPGGLGWGLVSRSASPALPLVPPHPPVARQPVQVRAGVGE